MGDSKVYFPVLGSFDIGKRRALRVCYIDRGVAVEIVCHIARKRKHDQGLDSDLKFTNMNSEQVQGSQWIAIRFIAA